MSDLTIKHAGSTITTPTREDILTNNKKLSQMRVDLIDVTPTIETSTIDANDVLFTSTKVENAIGTKNGTAILQSICLIDQTNTSVDAGVQIDLIFTQDSTTIGSLDAAVSAADSVLDGIIGIVSITNYVDMINAQIATKNNVGLVLKAASDTRDIYVAGVIREAGTARAADAIDLRLGIVQD
jgi:hypothetical protein